MDLDFTLITVDDSLTMRRIIKNTLNKVGFKNILEAADGVEALDIIANNKVDLIITDWNMPEMDGLEFIRTLKASNEFKYIPILMVTTEAAKEDILEALRHGVNNYIVKPFTPDTLKGKTFKLLGINT